MRRQSLWSIQKSVFSFFSFFLFFFPLLRLPSQEAVLSHVTTVQTHLVQQGDVLQGLALALGVGGAAGASLYGALLRRLRAVEDNNRG